MVIIPDFNSPTVLDYTSLGNCRVSLVEGMDGLGCVGGKTDIGISAFYM
jgi:hypothetical protein